MTTQAESPLIDLLKEIDANRPEMLLSDGATDWTAENLITALRQADEPDMAEYVFGSDDGLVTIERLDSDGFRESPPAYRQVASTEDHVRRAARADAALFFVEFREVIDPAATDWDAVAWSDTRESLSLTEDEGQRLWLIYQAALVAETERLCGD